MEDPRIEEYEKAIKKMDSTKIDINSPSFDTWQELRDKMQKTLEMLKFLEKIKNEPYRNDEELGDGEFW